MRVFRQCVLIFVLLSFYYKHLSYDFSPSSSCVFLHVAYAFVTIITDRNTKRTVLVNEISIDADDNINYALLGYISVQTIDVESVFFCDIPKKIDKRKAKFAFFSLKTCFIKKKFAILI